jgi:6-phosphogluconolactonase
LFTTNYSSGDIVVLPIDDDGGLAEAVTRVVHTGEGGHAERQGSPHPHSSVLSPDDRFLIVADLGIDQLIVYAWDAGSGDLQRHSVARSRPGAGPRSAVFDPSGKYLCVVNELDNTIALLAWDATQGTLEEVQVVPTLPAGLDVPNLAADVCFDAPGHAVYVSNRGHDSVMAYSFDPDFGLTTIGSRPSGGRSPRAIAVDPDGEHLLIANERSDLVVSMRLAVQEAEREAASPVLSIEHPSVVVFA